jgi:hypothetical protein
MTRGEAEKRVISRKRSLASEATPWSEGALGGEGVAGPSSSGSDEVDDAGEGGENESGAGIEWIVGRALRDASKSVDLRKEFSSRT